MTTIETKQDKKGRTYFRIVNDDGSITLKPNKEMRYGKDISGWNNDPVIEDGE